METDEQIAKQVFDKLIGELPFFVCETHLDRNIINVGWGNGYVCIPKWHPCFGMDYNDIYEKYGIHAHGGLTFADKSNNLKQWPCQSEIPDGEYWIVGFDTAHSGDDLQRWPKEAVIMETKDLAIRLAAIR